MRTSAIILILILMTQTAYASDGSIWIGPQNAFYPLKIWIEKFSLNFIFNQTEKTMKMVDLAGERLAEAKEVENSSSAFEKAMNEYADQLMEIENITKTHNRSEIINNNIIKKIEGQRNIVKAFSGSGNIAIIQQNIIEASSSSGGSNIKVSVVNGNVSVHTEGGNATVTKDGSNVTVVSITNNSRQLIIIKSIKNQSSSSSVVVQSNS